MIGDIAPESFVFPEGCEACPEQCAKKSELDTLNVLKQCTQYEAEGFLGEEGVKTVAAMVEFANGDEELADLIHTDARNNIVSALDGIDAEIEEAKQQSVALARSCDKPLKMRAEKSGITYEVTICTSALAHFVNSDIPHHSETHVWATIDKHNQTNPEQM